MSGGDDSWDGLPPDPFVIVDVPLSEDSPDGRWALAVPVEKRDEFVRHLQAGMDVLEDDEDLQFPSASGQFVYIPKDSLALAIRQLRGED